MFREDISARGVCCFDIQGIVIRVFDTHVASTMFESILRRAQPVDATPIKLFELLGLPGDRPESDFTGSDSGAIAGLHAPMTTLIDEYAGGIDIAQPEAIRQGNDEEIIHDAAQEEIIHDAAQEEMIHDAAHEEIIHDAAQGEVIHDGGDANNQKITEFRQISSYKSYCLPANS